MAACMSAIVTRVLMKDSRTTCAVDYTVDIMYIPLEFNRIIMSDFITTVSVTGRSNKMITHIEVKWLT